MEQVECVPGVLARTTWVCPETVCALDNGTKITRLYWEGAEIAIVDTPIMHEFPTQGKGNEE